MIACKASPEGNEYTFKFPPSTWKLPLGYRIKMARYPGESATVEAVEPPTWNGEGLPPVGTVCEVREMRVTPANAFEDWSKCSIIAHNTGSSGDPQVCTTDDRGDFAIFYPSTDGTEFRPIRTPEQIAAEERLEAIGDMVRAIGLECPGAAEYIRCGLIYDAGYRKQEQP